MTTMAQRPPRTVALSEPVWMLRINPLPRRRLADAELAGQLAELTAVEARLRAQADLCSDVLYRLIGTATDTDRGPLIAARRAIHNDKIPTRLPEQPIDEVTRWLHLRDQRDALLAAIRNGIPSAIGRERQVLDGVLADPDLLLSLAMSAPTVYDAAVRYQAGSTGRARGSERGLLQFVARAMVRTSPLSRLTAVGLAVPGTDGIGLDEIEFRTGVSAPSVDKALLGHVLGGLSADDGEPGPGTWIRQSATIVPGPDPSRLYFSATSAGVSRKLALVLTPALHTLLDLTTMGPRRRDAIAADLARASGGSVTDASQAVLRAVRAGFLLVSHGPEDCGDDPLAHEHLTEIRGQVTALAAGRHEDRIRDLTTARASLDALTRAAQRPAMVTVTEDYVVPPPRISTDSYAVQLDDLAGTIEFLSVFDRLHDVREVLRELFVERFGVGARVNLCEHARELGHAVYAQETARTAAPAELRALRSEIVADLSARVAAEPDATELVWPVDELAAWSQRLPERMRRDPISYGALVQPAGDLLVFNDAYGGHGMLYGRFIGADTALGGRARAHLRRQLPAQFGADGARVAEDRGLHRLNVNGHQPVLNDGLTADDWYRFDLVHVPDTDTLHVADADGRPMRILTLGAGHPERYPAPLRIATWLISGGRVQPDLGVLSGLRAPALPRLRVGSVVLQRRRWYVRDDFAQAVGAGPSDTDRLVALTRWRARYGVPDEVLLKSAADWAQRMAGLAAKQPVEPDRQGKPQYVDLSSALFTRALPRFLERRGDSMLEEALPAVGQSRNAFEWVVEISRPAGGRFGYQKGTS